MPTIIIVNASRILSDQEVAKWVPAFQKFDDDILRPAWDFDPCTYDFMTWESWSAAPPADAWPLFLNRHSTDIGVGGFHDDESGRIFGRIFVGDALRYGVSPTVDGSHEAWEMRGDPTINRTVTLPDGRVALVELCDPVEDDSLGITIDGVLLSDFVLPSYFGIGSTVGPYDHEAKLTGPCPTLTTGGYQSLYVDGGWTQVTALHLGGGMSRRSQRFHHTHRRPAPLSP